VKRGRLPDWCSEYERNGKMVVRFRRTGFKTYYFKAQPWTPDFMAEYQACLDGLEAPRLTVGLKRTKPGSFDALIVGFYQSPEFLGTKASSQATARGIIERFRAEHGDKSVTRLERHHIKAMIGKKSATPSAANNLLDRIRVLLNFAVDIGMRKDNPAIGIKGFTIRSDGFHAWTEEEIARFEAKYPIGSRERLAMALMLYTGSRRSDVVELGWQHVEGNRIKIKQRKTGKRIDIPIHPELAKVLAGTPRTNLTFLVTYKGEPFSAKGFGNWVRHVCDEAKLPECTAHGLRKAISRRMAQAGCSNEIIKSVTGHTTDKEVARYTQSADRAALADRGIAAITSTEPEQNLATEPKPVAKARLK
jgi:integrase